MLILKRIWCLQPNWVPKNFINKGVQRIGAASNLRPRKIPKIVMSKSGHTFVLVQKEIATVRLTLLELNFNFYTKFSDKMRSSSKGVE